MLLLLHPGRRDFDLHSALAVEIVGGIDDGRLADGNGESGIPAVLPDDGLTDTGDLRLTSDAADLGFHAKAELVALLGGVADLQGVAARRRCFCRSR